MSTTANNPEITPIPVQLSELEFNAFIFPHLSMPKRGPRCKLGYHRLFTLILWVLYTGMQWKCLPIPKGVVYVNCAGNSDWRQTGYDQPIDHLSGGADDAIRSGMCSRRGRSSHAASRSVSPAVPRWHDDARSHEAA
jgi:hypothetical protein